MTDRFPTITCKSLDLSSIAKKKKINIHTKAATKMYFLCITQRLCIRK